MKSPFPGMDPYLEAPPRWPGVHHGLISELQAELNRQLRPRYRVQVEERVYVLDSDDPAVSRFVPDLHVARGGSEGAAPAPAVLSDPVVVTTLFEEEVREHSLAIYDVDAGSVVTALEVLSPTNKTAGSAGRASYLAKRRAVVQSSTHLVELDLLRSGTPPVPRSVLPDGDYMVHVSRVQDRPRGLVWSIPLPSRLPTVRIPLSADEETSLDLQVVLDAAYERGAFDLSIDYGGDPQPPLSERLATWADGQLRDAGLR